MPEPKRPLKVFLSYASQDKPVVRELSGRLASEGWIDPWVDEKKLLPGHDWRTKIEEAVETSDVVIICLSSNSVTKEGFVQKELRYAREIAFEKPDETIFLIPLRLDDCTVPRGLRFYQWGDYFGEKKEETYDALLESLKLRHEQKLKLEAEEYARREKAEKERLALEEKTRKEAEEKSRLEAEERARLERDKRERKAAEANERKEAEEKARRETEERARIEKVEKERKAAEIALQEKKKLEAAQKAKREKAEREATERATQEKLKRDATEKAKRERAERQATQITALKETLSKSFTALKSNLPKAVPFLRIAGFAGIAIALFWVGSWGVPKLASLIPTANASLTPTPRPSATITFTASPKPPAQTATPKPTSTETRIPSPTATLGVGSTMISTKDNMTLLYVPAGEFTMGNNSNISFNYADERPMHKVNVASFWIDQTEVTNEMWALCVQANVCEPPHRYENYYSATEFADYPVVVGYDWDKAKTYCEWAGRRLPTEAEWEKAARGTDGSTYPWGESIDCNKANYGNCVGDATEVGKYPAGGSIYGALDMAGNVWEWVSSLYKTYPYSVTDGREDLSTEDFTRVMRGGSWLDAGNNVRSDVRSWGIPPIDNTFTVGFRCARDANP